jgi:type IV pilus assembly protein PilB
VRVLVRFLNELLLKIKRLIKRLGTKRSLDQGSSQSLLKGCEPTAPQTDRSFDSVLFQLGIIGEREVHMARAEELGLPFVDLDRVELGAELRMILPLDTLREFKILPVRKDGVNLYLATADPTNQSTMDRVRTETGCRILPVLALPDMIDKVLASWQETR